MTTEKVAILLGTVVANGTTTVYDSKGFKFAFWDKDLTPAELASFMGNPLQIFKAPVPGPILSDEIDTDMIFSLADAQATESAEDGSRTFDRGGLIQFANDLRAALAAVPQPAAQGDVEYQLEGKVVYRNDDRVIEWNGDAPDCGTRLYSRARQA